MYKDYMTDNEIEEQIKWFQNNLKKDDLDPADRYLYTKELKNFQLLLKEKDFLKPLLIATKIKKKIVTLVLQSRKVNIRSEQIFRLASIPSTPETQTELLFIFIPRKKLTRMIITISAPVKKKSLWSPTYRKADTSKSTVPLSISAPSKVLIFQYSGFKP